MDAHDEMTPDERAALEALRAADPVPAGADADAPAAVARIRAIVAAGAAPEHERGGRRRRRRLLMPVAAVALAVAVAVGVVGGRLTAPATPTAAQPAPVAVASAEGPAVGGAAGDVGKAASAMTSIGMPGFGGVALLEPGPALGDAPGTAVGYRVVADGDPAALAAALAAAFDVAGEPRELDGLWSVGAADGSGPSVTVLVGPGGLQWSYGDPSAAPCAVAEPAVRAEDVAETSAMEPAPCPQPEGPAPTAAQARARAEAVLAAIGLDPAAQAWEAQADGATAWASATVLVEGQRTPLVSSFALGAGGVVQSASGTAARLVPVPGYPTVGARSAVERSRDALWASLTAPDWAAGAAQPAVEAGAVAADPLPTVDGRPAALAYAERAVIATAEPALMPIYGADGGIALLPAYRLGAEDGRRWITPSVADGYVVVTD